MEAFATFIIVVLILVVYLIVLYNRLVRLRNAKETAYGQVETQLQLRLDLIPALVETVKGYASHEKETLTKVIEARSLAVGAKSPKEIDQADFGLTAALGKLFALAESYPDLKANGVFINLQLELSKTEATLNFARRFYNESVNVLNTAIQSFPAILFAGLLRFQVSEMFQAQAEAKNAPKFTFGG